MTTSTDSGWDGTPGGSRSLGNTRGGAGITLVALAVTVCSVLPVMLTGAVAVQIRADLGVGPAGIGLAIAAFFTTSAIGSAPFGGLIDRIGATAGLRISAGVAAVTMIAIGVGAGGLWVLAALLAMGGIGNGASHPASNLALIRTVRQGRQGLVFGVKQSAIPIAALLGGAAVPAVALTVGWRWAFVGGGVAAAVSAMLVPPAIGGPSRPAGRRRAESALEPGTVGPLVLMAGAAGLAAMPANSLAGFLTITQVEAGVSEAGAGIVLATSSLAGALTRIVMGWVADRRRRGSFGTVVGLIFVGSAAFLLLGATASPPLLVGGSVLAFCAGWGWTGLLAFAVASAQPQRPATATSIVQAGIFVGAASGPLAFGVLAERASIALAWSAASAVALVAAALMFAGSSWMRRRAAVPGQDAPAP